MLSLFFRLCPTFLFADVDTYRCMLYDKYSLSEINFGIIVIGYFIHSTLHMSVLKDVDESISFHKLILKA